MSGVQRTADGLPLATMQSDGPKSVGILFCVECNNMLYPKEDKANRMLNYVCRNCGYSTEALNPCIYANKLISEMDELVGIVPEVCQDPTLPRNDENQCPKCFNTKACFFQSMLVRTQSMKLFFCCAECNYRWTNH